MGSKRQIHERENAIIDEYMAKYPTLGAKDLTTVIHADGKLPYVSMAALQTNISRKRVAIKAAIMPKPEPPAPTRPEDGEQIAITGTISREELEALTNKAKKYDYLIRAVFAGSTESEKFPGFLYFDYRTVNDLLRSFEPEQYAATIDNTRRK